MADDNKAQLELMDRLVKAGHIIPSNVPGVWGRGAGFERILAGFEALVGKYSGADRAERYCFPPVVSRRDFETSEFLKSFPQLVGTIHAFEGDQAAAHKLAAAAVAHEDFSSFQKMTAVTLTPAACYPVYPMCTGTLPEGGRLVEFTSWCFRHEPSPDPARMQAFRVHEIVRIADAEAAVTWRDMWMERAPKLFAEVQLPVVIDVASDPFFGRGGKLLAVNQKEQRLKFEVLSPVSSKENPTAIMSFNFHQDHFGSRFAIKTAQGGVAQTACLGFGLERCVLALLATHGMDTGAWPAGVRAALAL
jgi:seryl-tRNA synthetase